MTRVSGQKVSISEREVFDFYLERARASDAENADRQILLQDNQPALALRRHDFEIDRILPLLNIGDSSRVLDIACGPGRWLTALASRVQSYVGTDIVEEYVDVATARFAGLPHVRFINLSAENTSIEKIGRTFDIVIIAGLVQCLNDASVSHVIRNALKLCPTGIIYCRGPVAITERLTLIDEWSDELGRTYNAIYRTEDEFLELVRRADSDGALRLKHRSKLYPPELCNREETEQRFWIWNVNT